MRRAVVLVEDVLQQVLSRLRLRRGRRPVVVQTFPGLATGGSVRVGARVLLGAGGQRRSGAAGTRHVLRANIAQFLTAEVPRAQVRVEVAGRTVDATADREGYLDVVVPDVDLTPGRHTATLTPVEPAGPPATCPVHVPDPRADLVVVSDIDDTIIDSGIAHGLVATLRTALLRDGATRVPLDGAPELYRALARPPGGGPERPFVYLSTSPWNLAGFLVAFLDRHGFPAGPLALTDWGPGSAGLFRIGTRDHKLTVLRRLAVELPRLRLLLVGDSGQEDPEIYTAFASEHPGRTAAVYIRDAGVSRPGRQERLEECGRALAAAGVPFVVADDSAALLRHAQGLGLVAP